MWLPCIQIGNDPLIAKRSSGKDSLKSIITRDSRSVGGAENASLGTHHKPHSGRDVTA